ncbi:MAG: rod shape-determining protein RodA [Candidatus Pelagibacterales bacterium]|nr:MAG: rod shape-determining protein RodA [Pelagibacterales bacterium]
MFNQNNFYSSAFAKLQSINYPLLGLIITLFFVGLAALYSISNGDFNSWPLKHSQRFILGLIIFFLVIFFDLRLIFGYAYVIFFLSIISLVIIPFFGIESNGATRWINIAGISLQPSEFVKYTLILALAKYFHSINNDSGFIKTLIIPLIITIVPVFLVITQPDLGTALIILIGGISLFWISGLNYKYFIVGVFSILCSLPVLWQYLKDYQKDRVLTFFNPERDPLGNGYHIMQSKIALGSGGIFGKGYMEGTQSHLNFLPEMQTDFIFTMLGEEFGFIGTLLLLLIYAALIMISIRLALKSRSLFSKYLSLGVCNVFFIYVFVNIGMVTGLLPVVGVPLPFISYGGSSMLAVMFGFGLLMNCYINRNIIIEKTNY